MKKIVIFVSLFIAMMSVRVYAQQGAKSLGASLVYGSTEDYTCTGLQAKFRYNITNTWRLENSLAYFLEKDDIQLLDFSVNVHYLFPITEQLTLYPLAGLSNLNSKSDDNDYIGNLKLGIGGGADYQLSEKMSINVEFRYRTGEEKTSWTFFSGGICYKF